METPEERANRLTAELRRAETHINQLEYQLVQRDELIAALHLILMYGANEALDQLAAILQNMKGLLDEANK